MEIYLELYNVIGKPLFEGFLEAIFKTETVHGHDIS